MTLPSPIRWLLALIGPVLILSFLALVSTFFSVKTELERFEKLSKLIRNTRSYRQLDLSAELQHLPGPKRQGIERLMQLVAQVERAQWEGAEAKLKSINFRNETMRDELKAAIDLAKKEQEKVEAVPGIESLRSEAMKLHVEANGMRQRLRELLTLAPKDSLAVGAIEWEKVALERYSDGMLAGLPKLEELPEAPTDEAALTTLIQNSLPKGKTAPPIGPSFRGKLAVMLEQAKDFDSRYTKFTVDRDSIPVAKNTAEKSAAESLSRVRDVAADQILLRLKPELRGYKKALYPRSQELFKIFGWHGPEVPTEIEDKQSKNSEA